MILGLTGPFGSGKTTIANYLQTKNFQFITLSDIIREGARKRNLPLERKALQDLGNELRQTQGKNYLAKKALEKIDPKENWIIDGIRNPSEIEELKKVKEFRLISLDAPREIRLQRVISNLGIRKERKDSDPKDIEEVKRLEARDRGVDEEEFGQQVAKCMEFADHKIDTNESLNETFEKINKIIENNS